MIMHSLQQTTERKSTRADEEGWTGEGTTFLGISRTKLAPGTHTLGKSLPVEMPVFSSIKKKDQNVNPGLSSWLAAKQ